MCLFVSLKFKLLNSREMFEGVRGVRDVTHVARSPPADCAAAGVVNQPVNQHPTKEGYFRANV